MYQHNFLQREMTNYLFKLALGEQKQIKFQFLSVYSWEILFIIRKEMFLYSGENCNNYVSYAMTKQNVQLYFLFKMSTLPKTSLGEHFLLCFVLSNADLLVAVVFSLVRFLIKTMGEKAIGQLASGTLCYRQRRGYSSHIQMQYNHEFVGQTAGSSSVEPLNITADKRLNFSFCFSHTHLYCLLLLMFHVCSSLDPSVNIYSLLAT